MVQNIFSKISIGLCALALSTAALGAAKGSADEAIAMVKKGVAFVKANGKDKAFAEFSNPKGQFIDRDLYIMVYDMKGVNRAHGANPKLIGKDLLEIQDVDGKFIIKGLIEVAQKGKGGWFDYQWPNAVTKAVEHKSTYVEKVDDVLIGVGIYK